MSKSEMSLREKLEKVIAKHYNVYEQQLSKKPKDELDDIMNAVREWLQQHCTFYESFNGHTCDNSERILLLKKLLKELGEEKGYCCECGAEVEVSSEGSLYCHSCATKYAK